MKTMRVEFRYPPYNARRYGRPWGAIVKFEGAKMVYDFKAGTYLGDSDGGKVYIECEPGDIVATGQRDGRGGNTENKLYVVQEDGTVQMVDKVAALEHWEGRKEPESPLAKFSTEELIAELRRRGVNINPA
jgi:hypothetical protein